MIPCGLISSSWLCQQSLLNRNLSVVHVSPSSLFFIHVTIISEPIPWISFNFLLVLPHGYTLRKFVYFLKFVFDFFDEYFSFLLIWAPMREKISICYSFYKSQPKVSKLLHFPPHGPHKTMFGIFETFDFPIFNDFFENFKFTIVAYGNVKMSGNWAIIEQTDV